MAKSDPIEFPRELRTAADPPPGGLSPARMVELVTAHTRRFFVGDLDAIRDQSLVQDPVCERFPQAVRIAGWEAIKASNQRSVMLYDAAWPPEYRSIAFGHNVVMFETRRSLRLPDGTNKVGHTVGVFPFKGEKLLGWRVYMDHYLADMQDQEQPPGFYDRPDVSELGA